jgi:hypothetical protein
MITEALLILTMLMLFTFMTANYFKKEELLKTLIQGPWQSLAGMIQNGVWGPPDKTSANHPNAHYRGIVIQGESGAK